MITNELWADIRAAIRDLIIVEGISENHWGKRVMLSFTPNAARWISLLRERDILTADQYTRLHHEALCQEKPPQQRRPDEHAP